MSTKVKIIARPTLKNARLLRPVELNGYHFADKHTVLTPELLAAMGAAHRK